MSKQEKVIVSVVNPNFTGYSVILQTSEPTEEFPKPVPMIVITKSTFKGKSSVYLKVEEMRNIIDSFDTQK